MLDKRSCGALHMQCRQEWEGQQSVRTSSSWLQGPLRLTARAGGLQPDRRVMARAPSSQGRAPEMTELSALPPAMQTCATAVSLSASLNLLCNAAPPRGKSVMRARLLLAFKAGYEACLERRRVAAARAAAAAARAAAAKRWEHQKVPAATTAEAQRSERTLELLRAARQSAASRPMASPQSPAAPR